MSARPEAPPRPAPSRLSPAVARQLGELVGDRIVTVAIALFVIQLTGSATDVGLVLAAYRCRSSRSCSSAASSPTGCRATPRRGDRPRALRAARAARRAHRHRRGPHLAIVAIGVVFGTAEAFFRPAASGCSRRPCPRTRSRRRTRRRGCSQNVAELAGPALATALVLGFSPAAAFGLDAATFLVSAALLVRVRPRDAAARPRPSRARPAAVDRAPSCARAIARCARARGCGRRSRRSASRCSRARAAVRRRPARRARSATATSPSSAWLWVAFGAGTVAGSLAALRWRPRYPLRYGMAFILLWPAAIALFAAGLPLALVVPAMARRRRGARCSTSGG